MNVIEAAGGGKAAMESIETKKHKVEVLNAFKEHTEGLAASLMQSPGVALAMSPRAINLAHQAIYAAEKADRYLAIRDHAIEKLEEEFARTERRNSL